MEIPKKEIIMSFQFKVVNIETIKSCNVTILEGVLISGAVFTNSKAELIHGEKKYPIDIKSVAMICCFDHKQKENELNLVIDDKQENLSLIDIGDMIISIEGE